jgi:hypothetical protein
MNVEKLTFDARKKKEKVGKKSKTLVVVVVTSVFNPLLAGCEYSPAKARSGCSLHIVDVVCTCSRQKGN